MTANYIEIHVAPVISERFNSQCICSFFSVPNSGGIPDKHPFLMCSRKFSICLCVSDLRHEEGTFLNLLRRLSKLASISASSRSFLRYQFPKLISKVTRAGLNGPQNTLTRVKQIQLNLSSPEKCVYIDLCSCSSHLCISW